MRAIALLSLIFGFLGLFILDGQTFTHAIEAIVSGAVALGCGFRSARRDHANPTRRWEGRVMGFLGCVLIIVSAVQLHPHIDSRANSIRRKSINVTQQISSGVSVGTATLR